MTAQLNGFIELLNRWGDAHWDFAVAMFVQVGILIAVLLCLDMLVLRRMRAAIRYAVWMLVLIKLVLPVSLHSPVSVSRWLPDFPSRPVERTAIGTETAPQAVDLSAPMVLPGPSDDNPRHSTERALNGRSHQSGARMVAPGPAPVVSDISKTDAANSEPATHSLPERLRWKAYVFLAWFTVALMLAVLFVRRALLVRRIVAHAEPAPTELQPVLADCLQLTGVSGKRVSLRVSDDLGAPAICGFWNATILLPRALLEKLDGEQMRQILVHELFHWRRYDLQLNCLQTVVQIAYFYNPLVWAANSILRRSREQAVDEAVLFLLDSPADHYSSTLLDIASLSRRPAELPLRLVGVVESRKALSGRIKRILSRPLPGSARLGLTGLAAVLLFGLFLLPMAGNTDPNTVAESSQTTAVVDDSHQQDSLAQPAAEEPEQPAPAERKSETESVLSGRIFDDTGAAVTDAQISLSAKRGRERIETTTDENGFYQIDNVQQGGDYRLQIISQRWVGISYRDREIVNLASHAQKTRDFKLQRACRLRVRTVDEEGKPIERVRLLANSLAAEGFVAPEPVSTDKQGRATLGGLAPSDEKYLIATMHDDYGYEKLVVTLDDPGQTPSHEFVLRKGKTIKGTAVCSDGEPPAGWRIKAMPGWWHFGRYPSGTKIASDGSFTLRHVVPGKYDVTISVPQGESGSSPKLVLEKADLWATEGLLKVKMDHPSPASLVYITGRVRFMGEPSNGGFWIFANSTDNETRSSTYLRDGMQDFEIGPVPKGIYNIKTEGVGFESKPLRVTAPAKDVELVVTVKGQPQLSGTVVQSETGEPVTDFRVRVTKLRTLSGPNYVQDSNWREFNTDGGAFAIDVNGPGIYQVLVAAEGFAWARSEPVNTVEDAEKSIPISLTHGVSLSGTVVDEQGNPVNGATVLPLSKAAGTMPRVLGRFTTQDGAVKTVDGRFILAHLTPGTDTLKVAHPDYCFAIIADVIVGPERGDEPLEITLTRGGTVRGHVYDAQGRPEPNVTLYFQDRQGYGGNMDQKAGRFATAISDAKGFYEVQHLPEQLCYVHRAEEWQSRGVVRHCILPENGRTHTLDFGGQRELTGRLLINGTPLSNGRALLSGTRPHFGIFKAYAQTTRDGSFTFRGIPPGNRTLYYSLPGRRNNWGRIRQIRITSEGADLGVIDHVTARVVVRLATARAADSTDIRVTLQEYNPIWPHGNQVGFVNRRDPNDPFVIEEVPVGMHELVCYGPGQFHVRRLVEVTPDNPEQELTLRIPTGTASLSGRIDGRICGPGGCSSLKVWSKDSRLLGYVIPRDDGSYRLENIPAGEYVIRDKDKRNAAALLEVSLQAGEDRILDFTPKNISPADVRIGFLEVRVFTTQGIPLPCEVYLEGPDGELTPDSSQYGRVTFAETPGTWTLVVKHPGYRTIRRRVELKPVNEDGRPADGYSVHLRLEESK